MIFFDDAPAEPDVDAGPEGGESTPTDPPGATASPPVVDEDELVDDVEGEDFVDDDEWPVDGDAEPERFGSAYAIPGVDATAIPTPRATASAPTRPTYLM